jgi:hypothetical protein
MAAQSSLYHFPKIYMRTREALHRSIANGGLKHSGIAIICKWRALQFCFKRRTPLDSILPYVGLLSCSKSFFAFYRVRLLSKI